MAAEPADWLSLNRLAGLTQRELRALAEGRACPAELLAARGRVAGGRAVAADLAWLAGPNRHLITLDMAAYPRRLREIPDPPPVLFVVGAADTLTRPQVAIVGSRRATPRGVETAYAIAAELAGRGLVITSGLALGVDAAGHRGALAAGGRSVAVAANGLDTVYPARHRRLAHRIANGGALVSEFPPGSAPLPGRFPRRNRVISGLCLGVLVVEAARRSGSLITARLAGEQGREVFAVPGPIASPLARGCHQLIREGAKLVEQVGDILEELPDGPWAVAAGPGKQGRVPAGDGFRAGHPAAPENLDDRARRVLDGLSHGSAGVDELVERTGLTADTVSSILLALELRGLVAPVLGGAFSATKRP